jgi:hypothetical protein
MVIDVAVDQAREIIAPSYRFKADVNEADMRAGAMASYGVRPVDYALCPLAFEDVARRTGFPRSRE